MQLEASTSEQGEGDEDEEDGEEVAVDGSPEMRLVPADSAIGEPLAKSCRLLKPSGSPNCPLLETVWVEWSERAHLLGRFC